MMDTFTMRKVVDGLEPFLPPNFEEFSQPAAATSGSNHETQNSARDAVATRSFPVVDPHSWLPAPPVDRPNYAGAGTASMLRIRAQSSERIVGMKKWEGRVTDVFDGFFSAILVRLDCEGPEMVADFDFDKLNPEEAAAIQPGDMFYMTVRGVRTPSGARSYTSSIRMRRLGRWTEDEVKGIGALARKDFESARGLAD